MILGIDEVGRGPWAGPLIVGAVVLPAEVSIEGLTDSKKLTAKKRLALDAQIRTSALGWGLGWVNAEEIDKIGLSAALKVATIRAVDAIKTPYHEIIIDGTINFLKETAKGKFVTTMPKADLLVPAVSAASIIAKVARDTYMEEQSLVYPEYGFASHVGYGTAKHQQALAAHGITPLHRKSFAPIAKIIQTPLSIPTKADTTNATTTKRIGEQAEQRVAAYFLDKGYTIVERNWRTKFCEIDLIVDNATERLFVEVKFRSSQQQGGGMSAVTASKLNQMQFAAELFTAQHPTDRLSKLIVADVNQKNEIRLLDTF